jgi:anaerobic glycerol-3-phosphate dehydrogenase B subunit
MSVKKSDVLVIGGGTAACAAAEAILQAGKNVTMVFPNGGSSEVSAGSIDILGVVPGEEPVICGDYKEGIPVLLEKYPNHVYAKCADELEQGVKALVSLAEAGGCKLRGFDGKNVWIPNMLGTFSINAYVPEMSGDGVLIPGEEKKVLVVGVKGNVAFNAKAAAMSYQQYQKKIGGKADYFSAEIRLTGWGDRRKVSDGELADYLDTAEGAGELIASIQTFCRNNRYPFDLILLPPVLGYVHEQELLSEIRKACGCKAAEVQALGNSVVGYRFTRALYRGLEMRGARLLRGAKVTAVSPAENGIEAECTVGLTDQLHPGEKVTVHASSAVLATGGFVGGGIKARRTEVWIELLDKKLGGITADLLDRGAVSTSGQEFLRMGAEVNEDMSVKDEKYSGRLFACGGVLAGHNSASERSGAGIAAASAYLAGKNAALNI